MIYMTAEHGPPGRHILQNGHLHAVAPLIRREDIHRLAQLGVLRHLTADGPAPLGYGPWRLAEDAVGVHYVREPAGTQEERDVELARLALRERRAQWAQQAAERKAREARRVLATEATPETIKDHINAVRTLAGD
jgi:hypothetical protein